MVHKLDRVRLMPRESVDSQESVEMDEYSDEDEDEVFAARGTNIRKANGDDLSGGACKPLMKRKKKKKKNGELHAAIRTSKPKYKKCCGPLCCIFLAFKTLIAILIITIVLVNYFTHASWWFWRWGSSGDSDPDNFAPCHGLEVIPVWQQKFPKLGADGNFQLLNLTNDNVLDVVFGFGTGADGYNVPDFVCDIYFGGRKPCFGGVKALDGKTGQTIWTIWASHEIFAITCQGDLDGDNVTDCVAGGRAGVFFAFSSKKGKVLWKFEKHIAQSDLMSVYAAQFIKDVNADGVPDILAVHGGDDLSDPALEEHMFGRLILFNGKNGSVLTWMQAPDRREIYYPPQMLTGPDGEDFILFGTGGTVRSGSLYVISLTHLLQRHVSKAKAIYTDGQKGMLTPAALVDINNDGVDDIVIATFNSLVIAFDGKSFEQIWSTKFAASESYSTIGVGYYDEDDVPDFLVKYQHGELGFPVYEYEQTVVLNGRNGSKISPVMTDSLGSQSSPLSISVMGKGNDIFLHWMSNCKGHDKEALEYNFARGENMHDMKRADICKSLFGTYQELTLLALQRFNNTQETTIYNSLWWDSFEHANLTNTLDLARRWTQSNPDHQEEYKKDPGAARHSVTPFRRDEVSDSFLAMLEKEMAKQYDDLENSEGNIDYMEGAEMMENPDTSARLVDKSDRSSSGESEEVMPASGLRYNQPHRVEKNPSELAENQQDSFENPYAGGSRDPVYQVGQVVNYSPDQPGVQQQQQAPDYGNVVNYPPPVRPVPLPGYPQPIPYPQYPPQPYGLHGNIRIKRSLPSHPHSNDSDHWGVHRILSTGTLAPPILKADDSIDLIFATSWVYPARVLILQPQDIKCVKVKMESRDLDSYSDEDLEIARAEITEDCLKRSGHWPKEDERYETPSDYDPFAVNMGQLTVYRFTLRCACRSDQLKTSPASGQKEQCGKFLPYHRQGWPAFNGIRGDSRYNDLARMSNRRDGSWRGGKS